jgi:hypothetical protein
MPTDVVCNNKLFILIICLNKHPAGHDCDFSAHIKPFENRQVAAPGHHGLRSWRETSQCRIHTREDDSWTGILHG